MLDLEQDEGGAGDAGDGGRVQACPAQGLEGDLQQGVRALGDALDAADHGDGQAAYQLLAALFHAVKHRAETVIEGKGMSFEDFTASQEDYGRLCQWLWTILLSDGTRALMRASQWERARKHAAHLRGIGKRLLDGRQAEVAALCLQGKTNAALKALQESVTLEEWEDSIAACLSVLCLNSSNQPDARTTASMMQRYLALDPSPELAMFRVRVGLTAYDLSIDAFPDQAAQVHSHLAHEALGSRDGYVAQEILSHEGCRERLSARQKQILSMATQSAGLDQGALPEEGERQLLAAAATGERITRGTRHTQHVDSRDPGVNA